MEAEQARFVLFKASAAYPNQIELTEEIISLWEERLANLDFKQAVDNLNRHIDSDKYFPSISDIVKSEPEVFADYDQYRLNTVAFLEQRKQMRLEKRLNPKLLGGVNPYEHR